MANNRTQRIEGEFKRALSEIILTDIKDPRMSQMAGITGVQITKDLKYAKVLVSVYDSEIKKQSTIEALNHAEAFIRAKMNEKIKLRRIPVMTFVLDTSIEYSVRISKLIDEVNNGEKQHEENR